MATTRSTFVTELDHVVNTVLGYDDQTELYKALIDYGARDMYQIVNMPESDVNLMEYIDDTGNTKMLGRADRSLFKIFQAFYYYSVTNGSPLDADWLLVTKDDFRDFRRVYNPIDGTMNGIAASLTPRNNTTTPRPRDIVMEFKKGIKRDSSAFTVLKEEKQWDAFRRSLKANCSAQDVSEILNQAYVPTTTEDVALFAEKQKYMYAVFERCLLTDKGKTFVREHEQDGDAQTVFIKLQRHATRSTKALLDSSDILSYITSARLGDGTWRGTTHAFVLHWMDQIRLYESLQPASAHFHDDIKRVMLQTSVHEISELRSVKTDSDQHKTRTGVDLTFPEYLQLIESAASSYDSKNRKGQQPTTRSKRSVHSHDVTENFEDNYDTSHDYDMDVPTSEILAFAAQQRHQKPRPQFLSGSRMPIGRWKSISEDAQKTWDQLDDGDKAKILALNEKHMERVINEHNQVTSDMNDEDVDQTDNGPTSGEILAMVTQSKPNHPADIRKVLSQKKAEEITVNGRKYRLASMHQIKYDVSAASRTVKQGALIDRGANGGIAGADTRVIARHPHRYVDIRGIDNHEITSIPIVTAGAVARTQRGNVVVIMHQYAYHPLQGKTIHSSGQLESFKNDVNDKSIRVPGGLQRIKTIDGYVFPLSIRQGLPYLSMRPYTDNEYESLPHVVLTSDVDWNPEVLDHDIDDDEQWYNAISDLDDINSDLFDVYGNYNGRVEINKTVTWHDTITSEDALRKHIEESTYVCAEHAFSVRNHDNEDTDLVLEEQNDNDETSHKTDHKEQQPRTFSVKQPDYEALRPLFGWLPVRTIKKTFDKTTQYARMPASTILKKHFKSQFPALNVKRRDEPVATDTVYSDTPAIDGGETCAQIFVGTETLVSDVYGMKTDKQFINTLEDNVRDRGAMSKLLSDRAQVEISERVLGLLRALCIGDWQSEPHQQHQNPAERRYQTLKTTTNTLLDRSGSPPYTWLLCLMYVCFLLNLTYNWTIGGVPLQLSQGSTQDISPLLRFHWWEPVYFKVAEYGFPSDSREERGHFVGISEKVGHAMTYKILSDKSLKVLHRSNVRSAKTQSDSNLRLDPIDGEVVPTPPKIVKSCNDNNNGDDDQDRKRSMAVFDPSDLVGRTFLLNEQEDGLRFRARIVEILDDHDSKVEENPTRKKFRCLVGEDEYEDILTYNEVLQNIEQEDEEGEIFWKFRKITGHEGPLNKNHPSWKGDRFNVMIEWETGEISSEPLRMIAADDPITCAIYAKDHELLEVEGWKRFRTLAKRAKKMLRMVNQAKLRSFRMSKKYMFGFEVPKDYNDALRLDSIHGNSKWKDSTALEMAQLHEYNTFTDKGFSNVPEGYKKIRVHLVYAVKHDGRHKARLVADGHLTEVPITSVYSGVVSLRGLRMVVFLAELNGLEAWATDIGNAYLEAETSERVAIKAGPEFGELEGHTLIIFKALYGLRSSGLRWAEKFAICLRNMGFFPSRADPCIWMRQVDEIYEYIAVYVDDLAIASKDPSSIIKTLTEDYNFKLKGTGPISFHLGCDFFRDEDDVLCFAPKKYIDKVIGSYERMFGSKPKTNVSSPLEKGDHPEIDTSDFLDAAGIQQYQSLIGQLQWAISLGRFDITTAIMTMSSFRAAPRVGHLERTKRICGYLSKMRHAIIRIRVDEPDFTSIPDPEYDWSFSVYGETTEATPSDAPTPLGNFVTMSSYVDANLYHCMMTGRSVTGCLHLLNKTPIDWYSKKQGTVETATYGSEFVASRTCVEQIMDLRLTLQYLGVPLRERSYMFGDNESVVNSSMTPTGKLHKRHVALSWHRVREAIASGMIFYFHLPGAINPADMLSKHWGYQQTWMMLQALLFWKGDTMELIKSSNSAARAMEHIKSGDSAALDETEPPRIIGEC